MSSFSEDRTIFHALVEEWARRYRQMPFATLDSMASTDISHALMHGPHEQSMAGTRKASIGAIVLRCKQGHIQVVIQGLLKHRFFPGSTAMVHGFYKNADESIDPMPRAKLMEFD